MAVIKIDNEGNEIERSEDRPVGKEGEKGEIPFVPGIVPRIQEHGDDKYRDGERVPQNRKIPFSPALIPGLLQIIERQRSRIEHNRTPRA
jgi:hypothetical protein